LHSRRLAALKAELKREEAELQKMFVNLQTLNGDVIKSAVTSATATSALKAEAGSNASLIESSDISSLVYRASEAVTSSFPSLEELNVITDGSFDRDDEIAAEYQGLLLKLGFARRRALLVPPDSDTDEEETIKSERRASKLRRIQKIEGSDLHLKTIAIVSQEPAIIKPVKLQVLFSSGAIGNRFKRRIQIP